MGEAPSSDRILDLKICDPAMGSGAFLVEACRYLSDQLVAAWTREGELEEVAKQAPGEDPVLHARRLVAQRCLYGVDKNEAAVELAKLSLWLVTLAKNLPFTFLDHALRNGDSLVGLSFDQIRAFHWKPAKQLELADRVLKEALDEAIDIRQQIHALATDPSPEAQRLKETLVRDADDASDRARLIGDVVVGAFFAEAKDKAREKERTRRLTLVQRWLDGDEAAHDELRQAQADIRARLPVFHWMLEFPEVFYAERPDPLEDGKVNRAAFMDAFIGNPPFLSKNGISEMGGREYIEWLQAVHEGSHGNADISAHFFRRAGRLIGLHGTIGLIATNTIAQGDTRTTGLQRLIVHDGFEIYDASPSLRWPGTAAVSVSVVHLARGVPAARIGTRRLAGTVVPVMNSRLLAARERPDAVHLDAMAKQFFMGSKVYGAGFLLTPHERDELNAKDRRNAECIFPLLGGQEVNTSPSQSPDRYVINFGQLPLADVERWPDLLEIVRTRVKPERDKARDSTADGAHRKKYWWQFAQPRPELYEAIAPLERCLVAANVSKHLIFSFQPTDRVFAHTLYVFPLAAATAFAILQSRAHEAWARLLSSSLEDRLRYAASDCFETFPFPETNPRAAIPALEAIGQRLHDARAAYMEETGQGLTQTYNRLKDSDCHEEPILELRRLHEEMDRAVLAAYGWTDLEVPPYCPTREAERQALETFQGEVIDRLFILNTRRATNDVTGKADRETPQGRAGGRRPPDERLQRRLDID